MRAKQKKEVEAMLEKHGLDVDAEMDDKAVNQLWDLAKEVFVDEKGKPLTVIKKLDKAKKYFPLIGKFWEGISEGYKRDLAQQTQNTAPKGVEPPPGWLSMNSMEKLKRKWDSTGQESAWWKQGCAYDAGLTEDIYRTAINNVQKPLTPTSRRPEPQQEKQTGVQRHPGMSLKDLAGKYGEAPAPSPPPETTEKPDSEELAKQISEEKEETKEEEKPMSNDEQIQQITATLSADAAKYLTYAANYLNELSDEEFKKKVKELDKFVALAKKLSFLVPIHLKELLENTPNQHIELLFQEKCPTKFKLMTKKQISDALKKLDELKKSL